MKARSLPFILLCAVWFLPGCASYQPQGLPELRAKIENSPGARNFKFAPGLPEKILALDPEHVSEKDLKEVLAQAPAPRIINIHGGIYPVYLDMISFSEFLMGMGYPEVSIRNPADGSYSFSCYGDSDELGGAAAWYYERDGLRPMIIGHSQGGMQAVKVLHELAGDSGKTMPVWNPLTQKTESRTTITDPFTGQTRPVVGLTLSYATAAAAGGLTRFLPNQWDVDGDLREIPGSVDEFTGFYMGLDILGGDNLGFGSANLFRSTGKAVVRNVQLPSSYSHGKLPVTKHLLAGQDIKDWINNYNPTNPPPADLHFKSDSSNILWAADVWYSIKKHWVLELQHLIRARQAKPND